MGTLRIVAGSWKGRRIRVPAGDRVRPTPDRVREALFSILGDEILGARVLDAYAGTGALGLEALSRGAAKADFVEADRQVAQVLQQNLTALGADRRARLVVGHAGTLLAQRRVMGPYDLVFADPPYGSSEAPAILAGLAEWGLLASGALVIVERDARTPAAERPPDPRLQWTRTARYGRTCLDFYRWAGPRGV